MTCVCTVCGIAFEANPFWHHPTGLCGDSCRTQARQSAKAKYKKTEKGKASLEKWVNSDCRKQNEKGYKQKPEARKRQVLAATRYLKRHEYAREAKRERDKLYGRSERGHEVNQAARARYRATEDGRIQRRIIKARRRRAEGSFTAEEWKVKLEQSGGCCVHCGTARRIEIDHIVPIARGGRNTIDNVQPLCRSCNSSKGARL